MERHQEAIIKAGPAISYGSADVCAMVPSAKEGVRILRTKGFKAGRKKHAWRRASVLFNRQKRLEEGLLARQYGALLLELQSTQERFLYA